MVKNYFKIAIRSLLKHKIYFGINLAGLIVGFISFIIIMLYVVDELAYDRFYPDADRIHRVVADRSGQNGTITKEVSTPGALVAALVKEVPGVEHATGLFPAFWGNASLENENYRYYDNKFLYVDDSFFDVFAFEFIRGDAKTAFADPSSVILTESIAHRFFGDNEAIGKTLVFNQLGNKNLKVTGVIKDVPAQSHLQFDFLAPVMAIRPAWVNNWGTDRHFRTYVKMRPGMSMKVVNTRIQELADRYEKRRPDDTFIYSTQQLTGINGIHFSPREGDTGARGNKLYIRVLLMVAFFILLIAGINYVNLATARSSVRVKEIGIRKVVGAFRKAIIVQFLLESIIMAVLAGLAAVVIAEAILPFFNTIMQKQLSILTSGNLQVWLAIVIAVLIFGLCAGLYPALYLSAFNPIAIFRKRYAAKGNSFGLRKILVVSQFAISAFLLVGMVVVQQQMAFIQSADLGFDKDQVLVIEEFNKTPGRDQNYVVRKKLEALPGVKRVGSTMEMEIGLLRGGTGAGTLKGSSHAPVETAAYLADDGFMDVFGLQLTEGRTFSPGFALDMNGENIIVNETTVKKFGIKGSALGKKIVWPNGSENTIIGVVKDFHTSSLHEEIFPVIIRYEPQAWFAVVKLSGENVQNTLAQIEGVWDEFVPGTPISYYFMDAAIEQLYRSEQNFHAIFYIMTSLVLVIACLGLFGLAAFTAEQRKKEVSIRKVMGASVKKILALLSTDFIKLVAVANIIAWPVAWYTMNTWLENFAYRININWWVFILAGAISFLVALLTVSFQAIKAALANPVNALRSE